MSSQRTTSKIQFIEKHTYEFTVVEMCRVLEVSKSRYYNWLAKKEKEPTETEKRCKELKQKIRQFFHESFETYGAVRIHKYLLDANYKVSERTVRQYMQQMGLKVIPNNPYTVTTNSNHNDPIYDDLLEQNF